MNVQASFAYASGKIILFGEHSVVYGFPAIALPLDRGIRIIVSKAPAELMKSSLGPFFSGFGPGVDQSLVVNSDDNSAGPKVLIAAMQELRSIFGVEVEHLKFKAESEIPAGCGLGSSAALSVALIRAVHRFYGRDLTVEKTLEYALRLEGVFHGKPSGVDHSVISLAQTIYFNNQESGVQIEQLNLLCPLEMVITVPEKHAGTAAAVSAIGEKYRRYPEIYQHIFKGIADLAHEAKKALRQSHYARVGELMNINQGYLNALGVSTSVTEECISIARAAGALGAKLSGAGGGGAVIALCDGNSEAIQAALLEKGFESFIAFLGAEKHK